MQPAFIAPLVESLPPRMYGGTERVVRGWVMHRDHASTSSRRLRRASRAHRAMHLIPRSTIG
jgi:hypothetical protein